MTTIDVLDLSGGKVEYASFASKLEGIDWSQYAGQDVQLKGCAPTWAHLLVAGKLFGKAAKVQFLADDRKGGTPIEIFKK